jgi:hypothetical protein
LLWTIALPSCSVKTISFPVWSDSSRWSHMHLFGCMVVVTGCLKYSVQVGVLLHWTTSISKSTSEWSGIGSPPIGAQVKAPPQA